MASKYEKMEVMLEEIMNENDLDGKIEQMKEELKKEPEVSAANKKDYKMAYQKAMKEMDEKKKKLKFYEAFKNNKDEIMNIREYQLVLQEKLEKLEIEKEDAMTDMKEGKDIQNNFDKIEKEYNEIFAKREEISKKLKDKNLSEEEKGKLQKEDKALIEEIDINNQKYQVVQNALKDKLANKHRDVDTIENEIKNTNIKISKCNMMWSSLLKGKSWEDISVILQNGNFTAEKGTINKIRDLSASQNIGSVTPERHNTDNNIQQEEKNMENNDEIYEDIDEEENNGGRFEDIDEEENDDERFEDIDEEENDDERFEDIDEEENNLPVETKSFAERHPRLAKIPFLVKIVDSVNNLRMKKKVEREMEQEVNQETTQEEVTVDNDEVIDNEMKGKDEMEQEVNQETTQEEVTMGNDEALDYIDNKMKDKDEIEIYKNIAKSGFRESIKVDKEERRKNAKKILEKNKLIAAKEYAKKYGSTEKYGSRYNTQDGADRDDR